MIFGAFKKTMLRKQHERIMGQSPYQHTLCMKLHLLTYNVHELNLKKEVCEFKLYTHGQVELI